ncbi:MAG: peptidylprolyl isomerase [Bdellovibrionales bacterium]|nr:peptidylprolyl isomerase [Bdellovibrionales bacterium]
MRVLIFTAFVLTSLFAHSQESGLNTFVLLKTSMGDIRLKLYNKDAPLTVQNFVELARGSKPYKDAKTGKRVLDKPFYNGLIFHKVHPKLGIQSGCPWGTGKGWPGFTIKDETGNKLNFDRPYLLGMAKIDGQPDTAGSQFFISTKALPHLNGQYTVFGEVVSGHDVVKRISRAPRDSMMKPLKSITLTEVIVE